MGFVTYGTRTKEMSLGEISLETIHKQQCNVCPLKSEWDHLRHPHMEPYGSKTPLIYMLGEAPGADEDEKGMPFVGKAGRLLHSHLPSEIKSSLRWNNCVRTRPPKNRTPVQFEIECCRPSVEGDIEATRPRAIFGFGNIPLSWALRQSGVSYWRGRKIPIRVGQHACWYYSMYHPSYVNRMRGQEPAFGDELEFVFRLDLERALNEVPNLPDPVVHTEKDAIAGVTIITGSGGEDDLHTILSFLRSCNREEVVGFDYETNVLRPYYEGAKILSASISTPQKTLAFPLYHSQSPWTQEQVEVLERAFAKFLFEAPCIKVSFNLDFELVWSAFFYGREVIHAGKWGDAQAQAFILDERIPQGHKGISLESTCVEHFGLSIKSINNTNTAALDRTPLKTVLLYNGIDAKYHLNAFLKQEWLLADRGLLEVYDDHIRRIQAAALIQLKGVPIDQAVVTQILNEYESKVEAKDVEIQGESVTEDFAQKFEHKFNASSPPDVLKLFRQILGYDIPGTDESVLSTIEHPIAKKILDWRTIKKMQSTYIFPVKEGHEKSKLLPDGLAHPILNCSLVRTSRTSSSDFNIQNWPKHDETGEAKKIRQQVTPPPGYKIVAFDYGGMQARNVAMESQDKNLVTAFWNKYDVHADWRDQLIKASPGWVKGGAKAIAADPELAKYYRQESKNGFVFASFFGATPKTVAHRLLIPESDAARAQGWFWQRFPEVRGWHERLLEDYRNHGYIQGLAGYWHRAPIERNQTINSLIQADEAKIVCRSMERLCEIGDERLTPNLMVHDDLTFVWQVEEIDMLAEQVITEMLTIDFDWINVPLSVEMSVGDDWGHLKKVEEYFSNEWFAQ